MSFKKLYNYYADVSGYGKFYFFLRWTISPFERISKILNKTGLYYELGCAEGVLSNCLAVDSEKRVVVGLDCDKKKIQLASKTLKERKNIKFAYIDVFEFNYGKADGFIFSDFLHHLSYDKQMELLRICSACLNDNGVLIIKEIDKSDCWFRYLPSALSDRLLYPKDKIYFRSKNEWKEVLEQLGYKVEAISVFWHIPLSNTLFIARK